MICYLFPAPTYFIFSSEIPALLYYSHIPATILALAISFYVFWNGRHLLLNRLLFLVSIFFSLWTISTLIAWTNINANLISFVWSFFGLILGLISIFSIYFMYVFLEKKDISIKFKAILLLIISPILFLTPTSFNIRGFNITDCDAFKFEWLPFKLYYTLLGMVAMICILCMLINSYKKAAPDFKKQIILMGTGIELFLFSFFGMEFLASYLTRIGVLHSSEIEIYGMFGMVIFMIYISILMVRFSLFNTKLIATQALVWGLSILIGSQFFFIKIPINFVLNGVTFVASVVLGHFLIKSVKKEIKQKEELKELSERLEVLNEKLKSLDKLKTEFLSLASHQLRSPLTSIKGYTSMLLDGDFGEVSLKQKEAIDRVFESSKHLTNVVEDLLDVAKIEQGGMQYVMNPFDFEKIVHDLEIDLNIIAEKKGIKLFFETDNKSPYRVNGDMEKIRQVVLNIIDNSIKYTQKGSVTVRIEKIAEDKKVLMSVKDTGMGMTDEIKSSLFQKFSRGVGGTVNASGSGLGLYLSKQIIESHNGKVWVESPGIGLGSIFFVELNSI